jgi:hypothetical protein
LYCIHRCPKKVDSSRYVILQKIIAIKNANSRYKSKVDWPRRQAGQQGRLAKKAASQEGRLANKAGWPTREGGQQGIVANKAGWPARQAAQQGRLPNKAGWPTRQAGHQGRLASKAGWLTRQAGQQVRLAKNAGWPRKQAGQQVRHASLVNRCACFNCHYFCSNRTNIYNKQVVYTINQTIFNKMSLAVPPKVA